MKQILSLGLMASVLVLASAGYALAGTPPVQIPEPSSLALIAGAAGVVAWARFRKRN
jgi:hypothetical protein